MDYVIDLQGFRDASNRFIIKEVCVLALQHNHVGHWLVAPPFSFTDLPPDVRRLNNHLSSAHHGIEWFDGDIQGRRVRDKLRDIARAARTIYTRGIEKTKMLQNLASRQITNLEEDEDCPAFKKLPSTDTYCMYHALHARGKFVCALNRATQLKSWLVAKSSDEVDVLSSQKTLESYEQPGAAGSVEDNSSEYEWSLPG